MEKTELFKKILEVSENKKTNLDKIMAICDFVYPLIKENKKVDECDLSNTMATPTENRELKYRKMSITDISKVGEYLVKYSELTHDYMVLVNPELRDMLTCDWETMMYYANMSILKISPKHWSECCKCIDKYLRSETEK